ncbi:MAG: isocitrate/isopropylmalate dehydrogenase family protein [Promethearchaeota archaeon]
MTKTLEVAVISGDGIGPEITTATINVLETLSDKYSFSLRFKEVFAGDIALKETGQALPSNAIDEIKKSSCCLKAPIGETARDVVLPLRQELNLFANIRPAKTILGIPSIHSGVDLVIVRENTEGLYKKIDDMTTECAINVRVITKEATERIMTVACKMAKERRKKLTIVHKANVMKSCVFFRNVCLETAKNFSEIDINEMYVDNAAYQLVINPQQFDTLVTSNMFGDILSDEAAGVTGSLGVLPSANIGHDIAMFEPVHGAAFDITGKGIANPTAILLSCSMMLDWLGENYSIDDAKQAAKDLENSVLKIYEETNIRTPDLGGKNTTNDFIKELLSRF